MSLFCFSLILFEFDVEFRKALKFFSERAVEEVRSIFLNEAFSAWKEVVTFTE
jgi:hypothetical protein